MNWQVYMILCSDTSIYTGISTNVAARFQQHAQQKGAKYFRGRQPEQLIFVESGHTRSSASRREAQIKKYSHQEKLNLAAALDQKNIELA